MPHLQYATLRRLVFVNINFREINFRVDLFLWIQLCHISNGFTFADKEIYIILRGYIFAAARYVMCMMIAEKPATVFKITEDVLTESAQFVLICNLKYDKCFAWMYFHE